MFKFRAPVWQKYMGIAAVHFTPLGRIEQNRAAVNGFIGKLNKVLLMKSPNKYIQLYKSYRSYYK